ncbi:RDD family protein [Aliamphritea spongicola]|uniref:RDD family protein n=1 Tax=Aliamphritea spongicola TaxID=707589 RepID=UPI00196AE4A6|nr:RDD family protein [Aliamphritea spongicola]MBN3563940.1 RDD family protein [Aliamphritea spongicola]
MNKPFPELDGELRQPSLLRRLAAMVYDGLLVVAIWMCTGFVAVGLNGGESVSGPLFQSALFLITFGFFAYFWIRLGQTLGMQAWQLRVQTIDNRHINLKQALLRFMMAIVSFACGGLGFLWMLFSPSKATWHDSFSETQIVLLPKKQKS